MSYGTRRSVRTIQDRIKFHLEKLNGFGVSSDACVFLQWDALYNKLIRKRSRRGETSICTENTEYKKSKILAQNATKDGTVSRDRFPVDLFSFFALSVINHV